LCSNRKLKSFLLRLPHHLVSLPGFLAAHCSLCKLVSSSRRC
jgi:hypothetical protein